jgi:hypothetical protein
MRVGDECVCVIDPRMLDEEVCAESGNSENQSRPPSFVCSCDSHLSTWPVSMHNPALRPTGQGLSQSS